MHLEKRVLVTGGAGFLGSHLCERLLTSGAIVVCVDNVFTGARRNIEHLLDHKHFEVIRHDVTFSLYVEVDEIYNLACPASPIHYQRDPVQTTKTSTGLSICWALPNVCGQESSRHPHPKFTAIRVSILRSRIIGGTLTRLGRALVMMKLSVVQKHCFLTIGGSTNCRSRSLGSSIPMARVCTRTTGGSSRILLYRRCSAVTSPSMATALRPAPSAMSMI